MKCSICGANIPEGIGLCQECKASLMTSGSADRVTIFQNPAVQFLRTQPSRLAQIAHSLSRVGSWVWPLAPLSLILGLAAVVRTSCCRGRVCGHWLASEAVLASILPTMACFSLWAAMTYLGPMCHRDYERVRIAICSHNLKNIGIATLQYTEDFDGQLPEADRWCNEIYPYFQESSVYECPDLWPSPPSPPPPSSYAYNRRLGGFPYRFVAIPGAVPMFFDFPGGWNKSGGMDLVDPRHRDKANISFADGHVKSYDKSCLTGLSW